MRLYGFVKVRINDRDDDLGWVETTIEASDFGHEDGELRCDNHSDELRAYYVYKYFCHEFTLTFRFKVQSGVLVDDSCSFELDTRGTNKDIQLVEDNIEVVF